MEHFCNQESCNECPGRFLCHCLQITEEAVIESVRRLGLETILDVRRHTGAGEGCTACHLRIREVVEALAVQPSSSSPICSVR